MSEITFISGEEPVSVPALTVFAVIKMIISSRKAKEFYESLTKEDLVMISPELVNRAKKFIVEQNVSPKSKLTANVSKCNTITYHH